MKHRLFPFVTLILVLIACELPVFYASPAPTPIPGLIGTSVAQTVAAARTQTALFLPPPTYTPTMTLLPTSTLTETPSPTTTIIFIIPTSTHTRTATPFPTSTEAEFSDENWACRLISKNPADNQVFTPRADFDARWVVENTGKKSWSRDDIDYIYYSGTKMHKKEAYDLADTVDRGESVTIIVDMIAPKNAGTYSTTWTLRSGQNEFCKLRISIVVK
jgi:Ig-like domain from next to BRCA1 gene